jgi:4-hydroxy-tetrahydrodipicolinate synthase
MFHGSMVALVTPFDKNGNVDVHTLRALVDWHIKEGTHAIIAAGTTGESGTLNHDEKLLVIKTVIDEAKERLPVIAGTAMNATRDCIALTQDALRLGAHAALIMTPAYIKPTQQGLYAHYMAISQATPLPIILYNVPGRTACDLLPETIIKLSHQANIVGVKEATGDISRLQQILEGASSMDVYSGDDPTALDWMKAGAKGVISVTANVVPHQMAKMCDAILSNDEKTANDINMTIEPLHHELFLEANPIPTKWVLGKMGKINPELRLPLTTLSEIHQKTLELTLNRLNLC